MRIPGALIIVAAIAIAVVSVVFNCQAEGQSLTLANGSKVPMKCYWSAMAEMAVTIPLVAVGVMMWFSKRKEARRVLGITAGILGALALAVPMVLIGVCANPAHDCNRVMFPAILLSGIVILALSLGSLVLNERRVEAAAA